MDAAFEAQVDPPHFCFVERTSSFNTRPLTNDRWRIYAHRATILASGLAGMNLQALIEMLVVRQA